MQTAVDLAQTLALVLLSLAYIKVSSAVMRITK